MALLAKIGYGQVEPNRINSKRTGDIVSDVPVAAEAFEALDKKVENGLFLTWKPGQGIENNLKTGELVLPEQGGDAMTFLVYNEVKLYHDSQGNKDFVQTTDGQGNIMVQRQNPYVDAKRAEHDTVVPRGLKLITGDVYTTNLINEENPAVGDVLTPGADGILVKGTGNLELTVAQVTTMADGQKAVKLVVTKAA